MTLSDQGTTYGCTVVMLSANPTALPVQVGLHRVLGLRSTDVARG